MISLMDNSNITKDVNISSIMIMEKKSKKAINNRKCLREKHYQCLFILNHYKAP
jgi:hypothetical protein